MTIRYDGHGAATETVHEFEDHRTDPPTRDEVAA